MPHHHILIIQPNHDDEPAYLQTWLAAQRVTYDIVNIDAGDTLPTSLSNYSALAMLGGPMSANDDLPFLHQSLALFHEAMAAHKPIAGHCLGGQLLAKAYGAVVTDNSAPEIGWARIHALHNDTAHAWLGAAPQHPVYQWHYQTFALPKVAALLATNAVCAHQIFSIGPHIGMQCHIEVDTAKLARWTMQMTSTLADEVQQVAQHASVQTPQAMQRDTQKFLAQSQALAARIYAQWLSTASSSKP
jgi:GMP synthase (glutamine-hydrolysing)